MSNQVFPTKGNLIALKKSLALASSGYSLLDKKRNILIREMMSLLEKFRSVREDMDTTFSDAYKALQKANIMLGLGVVNEIADAVPLDDGIQVNFRSVMGVDIPIVEYNDSEQGISYGFQGTNSDLDFAYTCFHKVKLLTLTLTEMENAIYRLADAILSIQRRANALKNVVIPDMETQIKFITEYLEEKEREDFSRLKVIKGRQ